jgi:uncharacterized membrane protein
MDTSSQFSHDRAQAPTRLEQREEAAADAGLALALGVRGAEIAAAVLVGLLICPPLLIAAVVVIVPLVAFAIVASLLAAVLAAPFLLVRHLRGHPVPHAAVYAHRVRHAAHAIADLLPHRIAREAR